MNRIERLKLSLVQHGSKLRSLYSKDPDVDRVIGSYLRSYEEDPSNTDERSFGYWALLWADSGFPNIQPSDRLAASLAASRYLPDHTSALQWPWGTFAVSVSATVLGTGPGFLLGSQRLHTALATGEKLQRYCHLFGRSQNSGTWSASVSTVDAFDRFKSTNGSPEGEREAKVLWRVFVGALHELSNSESTISTFAAAASRRPDRRGSPKCWDIKLTRNVSVNAVRWVGDYVRSGGSHPTVQSMVRGHYKHQPYGPNGSLRKWIHIEPYWRGPEDAPIAVRGHVL